MVTLIRSFHPIKERIFSNEIFQELAAAKRVWIKEIPVVGKPLGILYLESEEGVFHRLMFKEIVVGLTTKEPYTTVTLSLKDIEINLTLHIASFTPDYQAIYNAPPGTKVENLAPKSVQERTIFEESNR